MKDYLFQTATSTNINNNNNNNNNKAKAKAKANFYHKITEHNKALRILLVLLKIDKETK